MFVMLCSRTDDIQDSFSVILLSDDYGCGSHEDAEAGLETLAA